jgi:Patatin-like phospholipase
MYRFVSIVSIVFISACSSLERQDMSQEQHVSYEPLNTELLRYWGDTSEYPIPKDQLVALKQRQMDAGILTDENGNIKAVAHLALSGGGTNGAYSAGLLNAWTDNGDRPEFATVTGVSTGAIISAFAFLGADYDLFLKQLYTQTKSDELYDVNTIFQIAATKSLLNTDKFEAMVRKTITPALLDEVAKQYARGRILLIGTTNLDAQRPVIWNMGEIATLNTPEAEALFEDIIIASSSIPGVFPAKMISVQVVKGSTLESFEELHVDGGVTNQVFLFPEGVDLSLLPQNSRNKVYVIRNSELEPRWKTTEYTFKGIASRSIDTILKYQGLGDVNRIYQQSQRTGMEFNVSYIEPQFESEQPRDDISPAYMIELFNDSYKKMRDRQSWHQVPPNLRSHIVK